MKKVFFIVCCFFLCYSLQAQTGMKPLQLKDIVENKYKPSSINGIRSLPDGEHYTMISEDAKSIDKYSYKTGQKVETLFNVDNARETKIDNIEGYSISSTGHRIIVWNNKEYIYRRSWKADVYHYDVRRNYLTPLSDNPGKMMSPVFSTDGRMCAFVKDNNLWIKKFDFDTEIQITKDGSFGKILNGITDWVYEEEFGITNLISWSADSNFVAFLKSDESDVPTFNLQQFDGSLYPPVYSYKYPKAGENNSRVACYVYNIETKDTKKMDVPLDEDGYIPMIKFTENLDQLMIMTLNRHQNIFCMYMVNSKSTVAKLVLKDENPYYIEPKWVQNICFSKDNFAYVCEKDGYAHIYLYTINGILVKQITKGAWDVTNFYGFDSASKTFFYQSAEESPLKRTIYKIDDKGKKTKLSAGSGTNNAQFSSTLKYYINDYSNASTPNRITLHDDKGKELSLINDNSAVKNALTGCSLPKKEFITLKNRHGDDLNAWLLTPEDFNPTKQYPLVLVQYSGPNSQEVRDMFDIDWHYSLCNEGFIVAAIDGRGTGARGQEFRKCTYLKLGILEAEDQIDAAKELGAMSYVNKDRIAIWGWSFGGFTTLMSMSKSNVFKAGIAIAPVTDWRFYDSVYTERFMRTPKENYNNYELCSPINLADKLQGNLLLIHGTADDNVHIQNSMYYSEALVEAGKQFDMQVYSNKNHSILGATTRNHLYTRITNFLKNNL
ncbi:S9 family peptidase [Bacteroidales bacterium OttesenSCG-928-I14]|nr:S9 family peptidase [Bacteroidales bacterium OttesenSCG-928-I14]